MGDGASQVELEILPGEGRKESWSEGSPPTPLPIYTAITTFCYLQRAELVHEVQIQMT